VDAYEEDIARTVTELRPDLVVFTGDSVDRNMFVPAFSEFLQLFDRETPKYAILGNWEHAGGVDRKGLEAAYEAANCRLLVNECVLHEADGAALLVTGLDDLVEGQPDHEVALWSQLSAPNHLVLAHCPGHRDILTAARRVEPTLTGQADPGGAGAAPQFMLSGHTHGGQVALLGFAPLRPRGSGRYHSGWYRGSQPELYVSRGLGWSGLPVRIGAPPEVAFFEWTLS
jgi:predicted MPP superfamily phosphohydrolase